MELRRLGRSGALVSALALGTDNILNPTPEDESSRMIVRALDGGINLIDTSNSYESGEAERVIGRVLAESGRRDEAVTDQLLSAIAATVPMGRLADPDEIARVVCFLASDDASYMTGALVSVDAGYGAR